MRYCGAPLDDFCGLIEYIIQGLEDACGTTILRQSVSEVPKDRATGSLHTCLIT